MSLREKYQIRVSTDSKGMLTMIGTDIMRNVFEELAENQEVVDAVTFCNEVQHEILSNQLKYHDEEILKHEEAKKEIIEKLETLEERQEIEKEVLTKLAEKMELFWQSLKDHYFVLKDMRSLSEIRVSMDNYCLNYYDTSKYCLARLKEYSKGIPKMNISDGEKKQLKKEAEFLEGYLENIRKDMVGSAIYEIEK